MSRIDNATLQLNVTAATVADGAACTGEALPFSLFFCCEEGDTGLHVRAKARTVVRTKRAGVWAAGGVARGPASMSGHSVSPSNLSLNKILS